MLDLRVAAPTRSSIALDAGEDQINSLYLLFFEDSNNGSGSFLGYYEVPTRDADGNLLDPPLSSKEQVRVKFSDIEVVEDPADPDDTFAPDGDYSLLLVANVEEFIGGGDIYAWISAMQGKTESGVLNTAFLKVSGTDDETDNSHAIQSTNLPMNARVRRAAHQASVSVELRRSVFRVSVVNQVTTGHELVSASLWNVYPESPAWENVMNLFERAHLKRFYGVPATGNAVTSGLYAFENLTVDNAKNDEQTTCLLLGFRKDGVTSYYRANLNVVAGLGQQLTRNGAYRVNVKNINGPGEPCELDAYTANNFQLELTANEWNVDEQGSLLTDGDNVLAVPTREVIFTPAAESRAYSVYTRGPGTLELSKSILPAGITASLDGHTLTLSVTATSEAREGYIELLLGTLKAVVNIQQRADSDHYLELSRYSLPVFPGNGVYQMEGSVRVSSSGPWSARIYGEGFTFQYRGPTLAKTELLHFVSGQAFSITSMDSNPGTEPRYAFVSVFLDDEPGTYQVLLVSQAPPSGFTFAPPISASERVDFDAAGTRLLGRERYEVRVSGTLEWQAVSSNSSFQVRYYNAAGEEQPNATSVAGSGYFDVIPSGVNTTTSPRVGSVKVFLSSVPGVEESIALAQGVFTLTLGTAADVPATGGTRELPVTLVPSWPGATWNATVTTTTDNHKAYLVDPGVFLASGSVGAPVSLTFAKLPVEYIRETPEATVTVVLAGTTVSHAVTVRQSPAPLRPLIIQSNSNSGYGSLANNPSHVNYFNAFHSAIRSASSFGPSGTVVTAGGFTFTVGGMVASNVTIYNANVSDIEASERQAVKNWMNANAANFLVVSNDNVNTPSSREALLKLFSSAYATDHPAEGVRTVAPRPAAGAARRVWDYIFNGPFGAVSTGTTFRSDGYIRALAGYPATTVPLLVGTGGPNVAIDPTLRVLYIGDVDLFGTVGNRNLFPVGSDKWKLLNNLIAFMVNAAQYGDFFLSEFRD
jgi:hypothetical protein